MGYDISAYLFFSNFLNIRLLVGLATLGDFLLNLKKPSFLRGHIFELLRIVIVVLLLTLTYIINLLRITNLLTILFRLFIVIITL